MKANSKDLSAGLLFMAVAGLFALGTLELELGTPLKLGPGAFPLLLAGVLALLGAIIVAQAFRHPVAHVMTLPWRGMALILAAPVLFGLTVRGLGLVASIGLVVAVSAFASHRMSLRLVQLRHRGKPGDQVRGAGGRFRHVGRHHDGDGGV